MALRRSTVSITFRPNPVNAWFLRPFARPFAAIDSEEIPCLWGRATTVPLAPGRHSLAVFVRYRGTSWNLGTGRLDVEVREGDSLEIVAANGILNHTPFTPRLV